MPGRRQVEKCDFRFYFYRPSMPYSIQACVPPDAFILSTITILHIRHLQSLLFSTRHLKGYTLLYFVYYNSRLETDFQARSHRVSCSYTSTLLPVLNLTPSLISSHSLLLNLPLPHHGCRYSSTSVDFVSSKRSFVAIQLQNLQIL
jgi:hypothetical protein